MRRFSMERWVEVEAFRPQVLIGSKNDLHRLAILSDAGTLDLQSVDMAILVATRLGSPVISDIERVVLWQAFGVPVYELLTSDTGSVAGCECEAHTGWHLEPKMKRQRGLFHYGRIETELCECGRKEPRLMLHMGPQLVRVLAATA